MAHQSFFEELKKTYITRECKRHKHRACEGEVILSNGVDAPIKKKPCECDCHRHWRGPTKVEIKHREE